jgi:hypothetical protein
VAVPAVFALAGVCFGLCAAGALTWLDAGELGAAAFELGIAHPPGFPVHAQLHALVMHALPLGSAAFRGAFASGLLGAVALAFLAAAARRLGVAPAAATLGALAAGTSSLFALHATTIEVYSGLALFTTAGLWLTLRLRAGDGRDALALGLLVGLAAGHHAELRLFVLLLVPAFIQGLRRGGTGRRQMIFSLGFAVLGGLCVLYLPLRSATEPWRDWGNPQTLGALWDHLWGRSIRLAYADQVGGLRVEDAQTFLGQLWTANPALLVLGLGGLLHSIRRPGVAFVALLWLVDLVYAASINPMGLRDLQNGVPGLCCLGLGCALSLDALRRVQRWGRGALVAGIIAILLGISQGPGGCEAEPGETISQGPGGCEAEPGGTISPVALWEARRDPGVAALLDAAADEAPAEALALVASDHLAAGFAFTQVVEGQRPDLAVVVRQHVARRSSVGPVAARLPAALEGWRPGAELAQLTHLRDGWPVRWEWSLGLDAQVAPALGPVFPWFGTGPAQDATFLPALAALAERVTTPFSKRALAGVAADLGRWRQPRSPAGAGEAYAVSVALAPAPDITRELARVELQQGRMAPARDLLDALLAETPEDPVALGLRGVARANLGDLPGAAADWQAALALDPTQPEAQAGLMQLRRMQGLDR